MEQSLMIRQNHEVSLDGLRGIAISLVVLFHIFARWPSLTPWLTDYASLWPVKYGYLGVELFFLISGFLIAQSLESSKGFIHFISKRWLRLFPSMLLASCIILTTAEFLSDRPPGVPHWHDALPGLLFVHPYFFEKFFGMIVQPLEWAYWSLFVEVIFYATFGLLYFARKQWAVAGLAVIFLSAVSYKYGFVYAGWAHSTTIIKLIDACFIHFGWFYLGSLLYQRQTSEIRFFRLVTGAMLGLSIFTTVGYDFSGAMTCILLYLLFYMGITGKVLSNVLSTKWLVWMGFISYPLYLIHENALIAMTIKVHRFTTDIPSALTPLPGLLLILGVAHLLARYGDVRSYWAKPTLA
jgi:peptidoglycan/LPS O-acetylase OafA/YrhL